ncbi:MAG: fumarylacetoacetate hydrolase family protein [Kiritimatiellaeota bacterium]|nr:fumarylacetoacetate hydrolase family protein [Kiritimatiellota bacterium]
MRIARIKLADDETHFAIVEPQGYRLLEKPPFESIVPGTRLVHREDARLLAPTEPRQIVAIGLNYREHAAESGSPLPDAPVVFVKTPNAVIGPRTPIVLPAMAPDEVDYECELVVVIGRCAAAVSESEALDYVLGYTCGNDVSARDCQLRHDKQWARGKCFDTFAPLGPWIETDLDPNRLRIQTILNGEILQDSNTANMIFTCRQLVSYISRCMTLFPGSVIMTGTPRGVGFARRPPRFLKPGDTVTVEIEGIGALTNPVTAASLS